MLARIKEVVALANNPSTDAVTKKQALDYLEQIRSDPNVVQLFASLLNDADTDDLTIFVALQVLTDCTCNNSSQNQVSDLSLLKTAIFEFMKKTMDLNKKTPEYLRNKVAELITKLFIEMYGNVNGNQWPTFLKDIVTLLRIEGLIEMPTQDFSPLGLDYFLRICISINSEIADQSFTRLKEDQKKNNDIKDMMRVEDVKILSKMWFNILKSLNPQQNYELTVLTLNSIGAYISWIDITLIVNPNYISVIFGCLDFPETKIACSQCLCEIISKKMKPMDKLALLGMLDLTNKVASVENDDLEANEHMAKLVSSVGLELSIIIEQCNDNSTAPESQQVAAAADQQIISQVAPLVLKFAENEFDSVTEQCFPFISQYLGIFKKLFALGGKPGSAVAVHSKRQPLHPPHQEFLISLMRVIFSKMKIDDSAEGNLEEAVEEFSDTIRSKLKVFQDSIAIINPTIYLEQISSHIQTLLNGTTWPDMELAIYQMHNFSESIRNNLFGLNKQDIVNSPPTMIIGKFTTLLLHNSNVFQMDNQYVQMMFFELIVRHYTLLSSESKNELSLLNIFCSEFGMFNKREKVRLRTWYLFTRFIKTSKPRLSTDVLEQLIIKISPLLVIAPVVPNSENNNDSNVIFDSQLYLFEGISLLIGANSDKNYHILDRVLTPLFTDLEKCISLQNHTPAIVLQTHHILMAIGTLARGAHMGLVPENQVNNAMVNKNFINESLIEKFSNIAEVVLVTFSYFNKHENIRDASRFTFARLIPILNTGIVPYAGKLIVLFLDAELKISEMNDFLSFIGQMVHTFNKNDVFYNLLNDLLKPIISKIHMTIERIANEAKVESGNWYNNISNRESTSKTVVVTDSFRDEILLKKAYYNFLQTFVTNSVTSLLLTENNRDILPTVLSDLLEYTPEEVQETSTMKLALCVLANFVKMFGSGKCIDENDSHADPVGTLDGLNEFFITKTIPLVFEIPFKPEYKFNIKDGSYRIAASDLSKVLREIYLQSGAGQNIDSNPALKYMAEIYFPQIQLPSNIAMELIQLLVTQDAKSFEKYYVALIEKLS